MDRCPNCSNELTGEFCSTCGQRRIAPGDLSTRRFFHELVDEAGTLRKRFKTIRSLGMLFAPGFLTTEYLAGHRQRYLSPFQLYFVCAAIFFFAAPWAGFNLESLIAQDPSAGLAKLVTARMAELHMDPGHFAARFDVRVKTVYTLITTLSVVVFAGLLQLLTRGRGLPAGAHLVFAFHFFAMQFLLTMVTGGLTRIPGLSPSVSALLGLSLIAIYLFLAVRRAYPGSMASVVLKSILLFVLTMALNFAANWGAILLTLKLV